MQRGKSVRDMEVDWWSKYYASKGEVDKCVNYLEEGYDTLQVGFTYLFTYLCPFDVIIPRLKLTANKQ